MEKVIKIVEGVAYQAVDHEDHIANSCRGCVGYDDSKERLCEQLSDSGCNYDYVFKLLEDEKKASLIETEKSAVGVKYDSDKLQYSLIPPYALEAVAQNLTDGLKKYPERNNWLKVSNAQERYLDALYRHLEAHRKGEIYDTDNINPENTHMAAVVANALFLLEFMLNPELKGKE